MGDAEDLAVGEDMAEPELSALDALHAEITSGFTEEELAERRKEIEATLADVDPASLKAPDIRVVPAIAVLCPATTCGVVGLRYRRKEATELASQHRKAHIDQNRKAAYYLRKFQEAGSVPASAVPAVTEVENKSLEVHDRDQRDQPDVLTDNGYLDWQFGSVASGRDPSKMWHRKCGGEVVIVNQTRVCTRCGRADTKTGAVPILDLPFGDDEPDDVVVADEAAGSRREHQADND